MADPRSFARDQSAEDFNPRSGILPQGGGGGFVAAPPIRDTGLEDGIKALTSIEPTLNNFIGQKMADEKIADTAKGRADALASAMEFSAAVKAGKIPPTSSKWYMEGYKHQYGEVLADQWSAEAKTAWQTNPDRNSDNPNAADAFLQKFTADKLKTVGNDPHVLAGAGPKLAQMAGQMREAQAAYTNKQVAEKNLENFGTLVSGDIDSYIKSRGTMSDGTLAATVKERVRLLSLQGVDFETANKEVVQAFVNKARETGSFAMLKTLQSMDHIGNNPKYLTAIRGAEDAITSRAAANESRAWTAQQRADKAASKSALGNINDWALSNPGKEVPIEMRKALNKIDPAALADFDKWHHSDMVSTQKLDPSEIDKIERAVYAAGPDALNEVSRQINAGSFKGNSSEAQRMLGVGRELSENHLASDKTFQDAQQRIKEFGAAGILGKELLLSPQSIDDGILGYQRDYTMWRVANPKASFLERQAKSAELETAYIKNIKDMGKQAKGTMDKYVPGSARTLPNAPKPLPSGGMKATGSTTLTDTEQARRDELLKKQKQ